MNRTITFELGGHILAVMGEDERLRDLEPILNPFVVAGTVPEWTVRYGCEFKPVPSTAQLLSEFENRDTDSRSFFYREGDEYYYNTISNDGVNLVAMHFRFGDTTVDSTSCSDISTFRFSLWFAVSMLTALSGLTFVHSSCIVWGGKVILFLGESGTGKSTHTRLWLKHVEGSRLLNDDSPVIVADEVPEVYGSPWSGKTPCYVNRHFPLAAIVRLSQAPHNAIRRLSIPHAFAALQPSLPPSLMQDDRFADGLIDIVSSVVVAVPVYHLECLPDADAARLVFSTVFK